MKKSQLAIAAFLCFSASAAFALDPVTIGGVGVTLYGRVVAGVDYTKDIQSSGEQGDRFQVASNQWGTSYWGLRADAALSDGWKAIANLESGFGANNGQTNSNGTLFNRASYVGLTHDRYGTLSAGNHMWISNDAYDLDPMGMQWIGVDSLVGGRNWGTGPNTLRYQTPQLSGFQAGYMHMAGGTVGSGSHGSGDGISVSYTNGPLNIRLIADQMADSYGRYSGVPGYGLASQGEWKFSKEVILGATYQSGNAKFFAGYNRITAPDANFGTQTRYDDKAEHTWVGINYKVSDQLTWLAAFYHLNESVSGKRSNLLTTGVNYDWNKYFALYATIGTISNNTISDNAMTMSGANNHAMYYWDTACKSNTNCNGSGSYGGYAGFILKF